MLAVVIVIYRDRLNLPDCLRSLYASSYRDFRVWVVDNASTDGGPEFVRDTFPQARLLKTGRNAGFAGGNNVGIRAALKAGAEFVLLLNADTIIDRHCLERLMSGASQQTIRQPLVLLYRDGKKTELINTAGNDLHFLGFSYCGAYQQPAHSVRTRRPIALASGAAMLVPRTVIKKTGYLDEQFFMYHEDADFCWRARLAGFAIEVIPDARLWHKYNFSRNPNKFYYTERNRLLMTFKTFQLVTLLWLLPLSLINELLMLGYATVKGWLPKKLAGYGWLITHLGSVISARRAVQATRRVSDRQLAPLLSTKLDFAELKIPAAGAYNALAGGYWQLIKHLIF